MTRIASEGLVGNDRCAFASGTHAIYADAIDSAAAACYEKHQFQRIQGRLGRFYLPLKTALALVQGRKG